MSRERGSPSTEIRGGAIWRQVAFGLAEERGGQPPNRAERETWIFEYMPGSGEKGKRKKATGRFFRAYMAFYL
jgi:hypothetical protein